LKAQNCHYKIKKLPNVRHVGPDKVSKQTLFCRSVEAITYAVDIYNKLSNCYDTDEIPKKHWGGMMHFS